jgi:hypothetical protein
VFRPVFPVLAALLLTVLTACGGSTKHQSSSTTSAAPSLLPGPSLAPVTSTTATPQASPVSGDHGPQFFRLPSGNIGCYVDATAVRCDIGQRDWAPPPKPASCQLDYGNGISLTDAGPAVACAGDTVLNGPDVLAYGDSSARGPFECTSSQAGVSCRDTSTGHGFDLSRQAYRLY